MSAGGTMTDEVRKRGIGGKDWVSGRTLGLIMFAGVLTVTMALTSRTFLTQTTFVMLSRYIAFYILVALSQAVCLAVGDLNLTVGAVGSVATVLLGLLMAPDYGHQSAWLAVPLVLLVGPATGLLHGLVITRLKIDAFIVTLSMMFVYMGLRSGISHGNAYNIPAGLQWAGQGKIDGPDGWLYYMVLIVLATVLVISYMYGQTVLGRRLLATGSNAEASRLSGINTGRMVVVAHVLSGCFSVLAAILYASWQGNAAPQTGDNWLIISFAVAIIGGTGLKGSLISPLGILMGAVIFKLIEHSLLLINIDPNYSNVPLGGLILLAIIVDRAREHWESRRVAPDTRVAS
jgi:ribose transport system permease protein